MRHLDPNAINVMSFILSIYLCNRYYYHLCFIDEKVETQSSSTALDSHMTHTVIIHLLKDVPAPLSLINVFSADTWYMVSLNICFKSNIVQILM